MLQDSPKLVLPNNLIQVNPCMGTKVAIKSGNITSLGGIFYVMDVFSRLGMPSLIDSSLGLHWIRCDY